eukprot:tig00021123_g18510.t1
MTREFEASAYPNALAVWKAARPYVLGGSSGMFATCIIQPVDLVKVRLQLAGEGVKGPKAGAVATVLTVLREDGMLSFYRGLGAALLRQATYTTARLGLFNSARDKVQEEYFPAQHIPTYVLATLGLSAGGIASVFGTPADLALIRMQSDSTLPKEQRRNYTGVGNALGRIIKEEGFFALWKARNAVSPTSACPYLS